MRSRALLLPGLALLLMGLAYGPEMWDRFYHPAREYCEMHLAGMTGLAIASSVGAIVGLIAVAGGSIRILMHMRSDGVLKRELRERAVPLPDVLVRVAMRANVRSPVVCVDEAAPYAFCCGLANPKIYVSTGLIDLLDEGELRAVLAHEAAHASARDPLRALAAKFLTGTAFFLPVARLVEERYLLSLEFTADRRAARVSLPHLASALLKLLEAPSRDAVAPGGLAINPTEERIRRLTQEVGERVHRRSGLRTPSAPVVWSVVSSLVAVAVVAGSVQVISSIPRCTTGVA